MSLVGFKKIVVGLNNATVRSWVGIVKVMVNSRELCEALEMNWLVPFSIASIRYSASPR